LTANGLGLLARLLHGRLLIGFPQSHFAEDALTLELFLQHAKRLINVVVANQYLHLKPFEDCSPEEEARNLSPSLKFASRAASSFFAISNDGKLD